MDQAVRETKLRLVRETEAMFGRGFYRTAWKNKSALSRFYWTLRGHNPGGRGGAPTFEEVEAR